MDFSERLKGLRLQHGFTQEELAEKVGVGKQAISQYERGVRRPDFDTLSALCDLFNVTTDYMLGNSNVTMRFVDSDDLQKLDGAYYLNSETRHIAQTAFEDRNIRALFDAATRARPFWMPRASDQITSSLSWGTRSNKTSQQAFTHTSRRSNLWKTSTSFSVYYAYITIRFLQIGTWKKPLKSCCFKGLFLKSD